MTFSKLFKNSSAELYAFDANKSFIHLVIYYAKYRLNDFFLKFI